MLWCIISLALMPRDAPEPLEIDCDAPWCLSIAMPRGVLRGPPGTIDRDASRCPVVSIDCVAPWCPSMPRGVYRLRWRCPSIAIVCRLVAPWCLSIAMPLAGASTPSIENCNNTIATTLYSEAIRQARPRWRGREADVPACASAPRPLGGPLGGAVCCPRVPARAPPDAGSLCLCAGAVARASEPHQELGEEGQPELLGGQPPEHEDPPVRGHREQGARGGGRCLDARRAPVHLRDHGRPEPVDGGCPEQPPLHSGRFAYPRQAIQEQCPGELAGEGRKRRT